MKISKTLVAAAVTAISGVACAASLPNVAVLATGGTIAGAGDRTARGEHGDVRKRSGAGHARDGGDGGGDERLGNLHGHFSSKRARRPEM